MKKEKWGLVLNILSYYIIWIICVKRFPEGNFLIGITISLLIIALQILWQLKVTKYYKGMLSWCALIVIVGVMVDSIFQYIGLLEFTHRWDFSWICPPELIIIWVEFAIIVYACLRKYWDAYLPIGILSFIGFALAYFAGVKLGTAMLPQGDWSVIRIGMLWSVLLPLLMYLWKKRVL